MTQIGVFLTFNFGTRTILWRREMGAVEWLCNHSSFVFPQEASEWRGLIVLGHCCGEEISSCLFYTSSHTP
jgi:hypothetical protein